MDRRRRVGLALLAPLLVAGTLEAWVDPEGRTHLVDDPAKAPAGARRAADHEALATLWEDGVTGPLLVTPPEATGGEEGRTLRAVRTAVDDLRRGDTTRATLALEDVLRREPSRPEPHFLLAILDGRRGRLASAEEHLRRFLATAGPAFDRWREAAELRLERLEDERQLMASPEARALRLVDLEHPGFRIQADAALLAVGPADFARTVARYLHDARRALAALLGVVPAEPTGVVLYGKAAYRRTHGHRFSFSTVGFFDGRIHVVSAAHPAGELRALLFHEYTHALFRERVGGDAPFWLNEGLAELAERRAEGREPLARDEASSLRRAAATGRWIPLARLSPGFAGLADAQARLAYREAAAAARFLVERTTAAERARLLAHLGEGATVDEALREALGLDVAGLDDALASAFAGRSILGGG